MDLWREYSNFWGGKIYQTTKHFLSDCSLLLITALNSCVNKTCWQHVTACDIKEVYIKTWFMWSSEASSIGLLQVHTGSLPSLWIALGGLVFTGRSVASVDARVRMWAGEEEPILTNETSLSASGPYQLVVWKMCLCAHESNRNYMSGSA